MGVSTLLASSALAFSIDKHLGVADLLLLGMQALRVKTDSPAAATTPASSRSPLTQAIFAGSLNPKVALFILAFLPQFVDPARDSVVAQFLLLGATMAVLDTVEELALVAILYRMRDRILRNGRFVAWQSRVSGLILISLGLRLAVQER